MISRRLLILLTCFISITFSGICAAREMRVSAAHFRFVENVIRRYDTNKNNVIEGGERKRLEAYFGKRYGRKGAEGARKVLDVADADNDGRVTNAEWERLKGLVKSRNKDAQKQTVKLEMSDGAKLATDIYLPSGDGPFPVLLLRTPYNKHRRKVPGYARRGYAVVIQDMRGRFVSEGENIPFIGCGWEKYRDGVETVQWITKQSWCNGKIGTLGGSALGITQNLLAAAAPEGVTAQYIQVAAASLYHHAAYVGGACRQSQLVGWLKNNKFAPEALKMYRAHPAYDQFWHKYDSTRRHSTMNIPAIHVGGWFDTFSQGTIDSFIGRQYKGGKGARGGQKLVMGPWAHGIGRKKVGELQFPNSRFPSKYSTHSWFDFHLKGADNGMAKTPAVAYYVMGDTSGGNGPGNEWRYSEVWPIPAGDRQFYLCGDGSLSAEKSVEENPLYKEYVFNPESPCPTVGGRNLCLPSGPMDQGEIESRADVLNFTTRVLAEPLEVTGRVYARIFIASSAVDTDLSVRLCDVYPNGKSYLMAEGMLRLRFRDGFDGGKPLVPGKVYSVLVDCWSISIVFNKGHRIRVSVTSSNHPRFDINPGTGRPWAEGDKTVTQKNRIYCGSKYPSHMILPVIPPGDNKN